MQRFVLILFASVIALSVGSEAGAVARIEPAVLDVTTFPREAPRFTVKFIGGGGRSLVGYPLVGELDPITGLVTIPGSPYEAGRLISANLEIDREELRAGPSGVERTAQLNVSSKLPPGIYHAVIALVPDFPKGGQEGIRLPPGTPQMLLNVTVQSDAKRRLNLLTFTPLRKLFFGFPARLTARVENGGNVETEPTIETRFFDRANRERGVVQSRVARSGIAAGAVEAVPVSWEAEKGFGRFRALISVSYGSGRDAQIVTASTTFWVLPFWLLALMAAALLVTSYIAARVIVRASRHHEVP